MWSGEGDHVTGPGSHGLQGTTLGSNSSGEVPWAEWLRPWTTEHGCVVWKQCFQRGTESKMRSPDWTLTQTTSL